MNQIEVYLKRKYLESKLDYFEDYWILYDFVTSEMLRQYLAAFHTHLNKWFTTINKDIHVEYSEDGSAKFTGGYFHAQDSRDYLFLLDELKLIQEKLSKTEWSFRLCNDLYDDVIRRTRRFVRKRGGSTIPEGFEQIQIEELKPIFCLTKSVCVETDVRAIYKELKSIGEGSYAKVYAYTCPNYQIPIVLKRAKPDLDNKELQRFRQEFEILKKLKSPYIVEVYAFNDSKSEYTMEFMDETILEYIKRNNSKLSLEKRKKIIAQICKGLSYIHSKNILHRDLSLTNIFIKHYEDVDVVKIGDFGLVKNPENTLTSIQSEFKGSLNDSDLVNVGFAKYGMCHETYALTRLCYFILTGRTNIEKQKDGQIKEFWKKGTSTNRSQRFINSEEVWKFIQRITDDNK